MVIFIDIPKREKGKKRMRQVNTRVTIVVELQTTEIHNIIAHEQVYTAIEV